MKYNIEFYTDSKNEHRWRIKSRNGKIIADSAEGYKRKVFCFRAVQNFLRAVQANNFKFREDA